MDFVNQIICGDAREAMQSFPENYIDLTVTSPPYDNLRKYNGYSFDFEGIANELYRVTKSGGVVVWVVGDKTINGSETGTSFKQALCFKEIGFNLYDTMIYSSDKPPVNSKRYEPKFEYMFVLSKGIPKTFNPIMEPCTYAGKTANARTFRQQDGELNDGIKAPVKHFKVKGNIWYFPTGANKTTLDKIAFKHPAMFPERLANDQIISWSQPGELIFDPFSGAGTTCKMALLNNRNYIGIDISQEYVDLSIERLSKYGGHYQRNIY